jgi:hypothetical protein
LLLIAMKKAILLWIFEHISLPSFACEWVFDALVGDNLTVEVVPPKGETPQERAIREAEQAS